MSHEVPEGLWSETTSGRLYFSSSFCLFFEYKKKEKEMRTPLEGFTRHYRSTSYILFQSTENNRSIYLSSLLYGYGCCGCLFSVDEEDVGIRKMEDRRKKEERDRKNERSHQQACDSKISVWWLHLVSCLLSSLFFLIFQFLPYSLPLFPSVPFGQVLASLRLVPSDRLVADAGVRFSFPSF